MTDRRGPVVNLNGTSRDKLLEQRCDLGAALREALEALGRMHPNARDYPIPGTLELAVKLQRARNEMLTSLLKEVQSEAQEIADGE